MEETKDKEFVSFKVILDGFFFLLWQAKDSIVCKCIKKVSDLTMKKFPRSSMAVGGKWTSKLTGMTEQIVELSRTKNLLWKKIKKFIVRIDLF